MGESNIAAGPFRLKTKTACSINGNFRYVSGYQKNVETHDECKQHCVKYDWCKGYRIKNKNKIDCRLLTKDNSVKLEGWDFFNKGNWVEPENWMEIVGVDPSKASYKCYEKIASEVTIDSDIQPNVEEDKKETNDEEDEDLVDQEDDD